MARLTGKPRVWIGLVGVCAPLIAAASAPAFASGLIADLIRPIAPQVADAADNFHRQIKDAVPPYKAAEEAGSGAVRQLTRESVVETQGPLLMNWIIASRNEAERNGVSQIPDEIRESLGGFVPQQLLDSVRWRVGGGGDLSLQQNAFRFGDAAAITLGNVVVFTSDEDARNNPALWAHELGHVDQFNRWGFSDFAKRYIRDYAAVEREAEDFAQRWAGWASAQLASNAAEQDDEDVADLAQSELRQAIRQPPGDFAPQQGNMCRTSTGQCRLDASAPAGTSCWCNTPFGASVGSIMPGQQAALQTRIANACSTPTGTCPMGPQAQIAEGDACACFTQVGAFPGTASVISTTSGGPPPPPPARFCVTQIGTCMMGMAIPPGSPCMCPTPMGLAGGIAQ